MRMRPHTRLRREESGQGIVEFALILPVLLLLLVGILEFGSVYSKVISMRQGVREAGRGGSVANFTNASCPSPNTNGTQNLNALVCKTKDQAGVGSTVKVHVQFDPSYAQGNGLVICAIYQFQSLTGLLQPVLNGRYAKTKAEFRLENVPITPSPALVSGGDTDPSGANWNWCT